MDCGFEGLRMTFNMFYKFKLNSSQQRVLKYNEFTEVRGIQK